MSRGNATTAEIPLKAGARVESRRGYFSMCSPLGGMHSGSHRRGIWRSIRPLRAHGRATFCAFCVHPLLINVDLLSNTGLTSYFAADEGAGDVTLPPCRGGSARSAVDRTPC